MLSVIYDTLATLERVAKVVSEGQAHQLQALRFAIVYPRNMKIL